MDSILVHVCCAPDAVYFVRRLREDFPDARIKAFFYDPNIHPYEEYELRLVETRRVCRELNIELEEGEYDVERWMRAVRGYEQEPERGERCKICFDVRLERSARLAKEQGFKFLTTTLLMSPKKKIEQLRQAGEAVADRYGIEFLAPNYRKGGGTQEMFRLSKEMEIYQQDYCGCIYGLFNQKGEDSLWDLVCTGGKRPGSKEEAAFIKGIRDFAESLSLETRELEFPFTNWHLLEGKLEIEGKVIPSFVEPFSVSLRGVVKADVVKRVGEVLYLSKQHLRIRLVKPFRDIPLSAPKPTAHPTFLVPADYEEEILRGRVSATLRSELRSSLSRVLIVGSLQAEELVAFPADTLQDGRGLERKYLEDYIEGNKNGIAEGHLAIALLGAESYGGLGRRFLEEFSGVKVSRYGYSF